jgi:hypothetical protein
MLVKHGGVRRGVSLGPRFAATIASPQPRRDRSLPELTLGKSVAPIDSLLDCYVRSCHSAVVEIMCQGIVSQGHAESTFVRYRQTTAAIAGHRQVQIRDWI